MLVAHTLDAADQCAATLLGQSTRDLTDKARQTLKRRMSPGRQDQATEADLELSEQLWQARTKVCDRKPPASEAPLALVIARLAQ